MAPQFLDLFFKPPFARRVVSPRAHGSLHKQDFIYCYKSGRCAMNNNNNNNTNRIIMMMMMMMVVMLVIKTYNN